MLAAQSRKEWNEDTDPHEGIEANMGKEKLVTIGILALGQECRQVILRLRAFQGLGAVFSSSPA